MLPGISERAGDDIELLKTFASGREANLRVAIPGIITSFDHIEQTVSVKAAIREKMRQPDGTILDVDLPEFFDVPVVFPKAGGYAITFPVQEGDECLVIFADMCIDSWFSSGSVQNQIERRRHDLSDGFAVLGASSVPNAVTDYNVNGLEIRNSAGNAKIAITGNRIDINGQVYINDQEVV